MGKVAREVVEKAGVNVDQLIRSQVSIFHVNGELVKTLAKP
jgi:ferritin-like protein